MNIVVRHSFSPLISLLSPCSEKNWLSAGRIYLVQTEKAGQAGQQCPPAMILIRKGGVRAVTSARVRPLRQGLV